LNRQIDFESRRAHHRLIASVTALRMALGRAVEGLGR